MGRNWCRRLQTPHCHLPVVYHEQPFRGRQLQPYRDNTPVDPRDCHRILVDTAHRCPHMIPAVHRLSSCDRVDRSRAPVLLLKKQIHLARCCAVVSYL